MLEVNGVPVEDTYAEAFDGWFMRLLVTAEEDYGELQDAATKSTALPAIVVGRSEGGVEKWITCNETPDRRGGVILQFWGRYSKKEEKKSLDAFFQEAAIRIRQGILVIPTTAVFNALDSEKKADFMPLVGKCGGDYEWELERYNRRLINVPIMMGHDFLIERYLGYDIGVCGGTIWLLCDSVKAGREAGKLAVAALQEVEGVITPFHTCSAGSKADRYPLIGPTTNHQWCPTLRNKIKDSLVPEKVTSIPEVVINGINLEAVKTGMKAAMKAASPIQGLLSITAGNYGGKLGKHHIQLRDLV